MRPFLLALAAVLVATIALNLWADVGGRGTSDHLASLARAQRADEVVVSGGAFDQRAWLAGRLSQSCPRTLVLGSSTAGALEAAMFSGSSFLNGWLSGPMVEDFEGVAGLLEEHGCVPGRVVIGVDPFVFNARVSSESWRTLEGSREAFLHRGSPGRRAWARARGAWSRFADLLSATTTLAGLDKLREGAHSAGAPVLMGVAPLEALCGAGPTASLRFADGHFESCPGAVLRGAALEDVARTYLERDFHSMRTWAGPDPARLARFERVVATLAGRGSRVTLFEPPYHPLTFRALRASGPTEAHLEALDAALTALAARAHAELLERRNPDALGCSSGDFQDSHHVGRGCAEKLARALPP